MEGNLGMEPTAPIIVVDHGDGGHCQLQRRLIVAAAILSLSTMVVIDGGGGGMEPTVRRRSLSF